MPKWVRQFTGIRRPWPLLIEEAEINKKRFEDINNEGRTRREQNIDSLLINKGSLAVDGRIDTG